MPWVTKQIQLDCGMIASESRRGGFTYLEISIFEFYTGKTSIGTMIGLFNELNSKGFVSDGIEIVPGKYGIVKDMILNAKKIEQ